ncbi:hypothetical protein [Neisseria musculi]|nr:hypothetical protein [Neisseria musculi]
MADAQAVTEAVSYGLRSAAWQQQESRLMAGRLKISAPGYSDGLSC